MMKNWSKTQGELIFSIFAVVAFTSILTFLLQHANVAQLVGQAIFRLFGIGVAIVAYYLSKEVARKSETKPWANYVRVYVSTSLLVLCLWAGHGTEVEWDRRSGVETVEETSRSPRESSQFAGEIFFTILPAALFGVYRGNKEKRNAI